MRAEASIMSQRTYSFAEHYSELKVHLHHSTQESEKTKATTYDENQNNKVREEGVHRYSKEDV